jgi:hypothetical protein
MPQANIKKIAAPKAVTAGATNCLAIRSGTPTWGISGGSESGRLRRTVSSRLVHYPHHQRRRDQPHQIDQERQPQRQRRQL